MEPKKSLIGKIESGVTHVEGSPLLKGSVHNLQRLVQGPPTVTKEEGKCRFPKGLPPTFVDYKRF